MPFNLILSIYPVFLMAMPVNMILVMYVILCILSYDFNKLTMLYIHVHISISMTNKSGLTFFLSIKYLSIDPLDPHDRMHQSIILQRRKMIIFLHLGVLEQQLS